MVAIVNVDPAPRLGGDHVYSLRINATEICQFVHDRADPLDKLLDAAAEAYRNRDREIFASYAGKEGE